MITAIDFGCHTIRSAFRCPDDRKQISLFSERAEYAVIPNTDSHIRALADNLISYAICEDSLVVFGNRASDVRWLSRKPCAPLFTDGGIPTTGDAPARQILNVMTQAMLPVSSGTGDTCFFTAPYGSETNGNDEFLARIIRMNGWNPVKGSAGHALNLAVGCDSNFTGISIVFGAEATQICVSRFGKLLATQAIDVGSNWIDSEFASQFKLQTWDEYGDSYLDIEGVRHWKAENNIHLRNAMGERERTLSRLYGVLLSRVAKTVREMNFSHPVRLALGNERMNVVCAGGATMVGGFAGALTERFVEHDFAGEILSIRVAEDPATAVVRGLLIQGELEATTMRQAA